MPDLLGPAIDAIPYVLMGFGTLLVSIARYAKWQRVKAYGPGGGRK